MSITSTKPTFGISQTGTDNNVAVVGTVPITDTPAVSGGTSDYHKVAAAGNNAVSIKASAGQVYGIHGFNNAAYPVYIKLYDKASAPAPTTDTVLRTIAVQAGVRVDDLIKGGLPFTLGIAVAVVKGIGDTDNTSVVLNDVVFDIDYK